MFCNLFFKINWPNVYYMWILKKKMKMLGGKGYRTGPKLFSNSSHFSISISSLPLVSHIIISTLCSAQSPRNFATIPATILATSLCYSNLKQKRNIIQHHLTHESPFSCSIIFVLFFTRTNTFQPLLFTKILII